MLIGRPVEILGVLCSRMCFPLQQLRSVLHPHRPQKGMLAGSGVQVVYVPLGGRVDFLFPILPLSGKA